MHGKDEQQLDVFSYISPEQRVPQDHPLRSLHAMTDEALRERNHGSIKQMFRFDMTMARAGQSRHSLTSQMSPL
jgi:hypothetical protein